MKEFHPTWLYIKTHNKTGLNYLGKTGRKNSVDPFKYKGSGTYWLRHIGKHGNDVFTFIIGHYTDESECRQMAVFYSWFFDIVKSDDWANLKEETLDGGSGPHSEETKQKIREMHLSRTMLGLNLLQKRADGTSMTLDRTVLGLNPFQTRPDGTSVISDRYAAGFVSPLLTREDGTSITSDRVAAGSFVSPFLTRSDGTSVATDRNQVKKECSHCHKMVDPGNYVKHHGDRCKLYLSAINTSKST